MTSSRERWRRISSVFEEVLRRPGPERRDFLAEACADEPDVRREVEEMLEAHERADGILDRSLDSLASGLLGMPESERAPVAVGPYRIEREIGRGGMGVVYRAHDPRLDRFVALKFLPAELAGDEEMRARMLGEAKAASALDHPNICTIYDVGRSKDDRIYIAMAYYEGETLDRRLARGALEIDEAIEIVRRVAEGLARAHDAGIVHRDIKPSNIMLTSRGEVKILDFGVAKLEGGAAVTGPGMLIGTPAYMAPEQLRGEEVDQRADLWALGVVLYEMLAGNRPFRGDPARVISAVLHESPSPLSELRHDVSRWLGQVIDRLLARTAAARYQSAGDLLDDLSQGRSRRAGDGMTGRRLRLPETLTRFFGREEEIERATDRLMGVRLLTLTGPAGTGKTRLALRVATEAADEFPDGVVFVPLEPIDDASLVVPVIAGAVGLPESPSERTLNRLKASLSEREILLILDNFEQVVEAATDIGELLTACPGIKAIVTSRVSLRLSGEHEFPVPPLPVPGSVESIGIGEASSYASVQLFRDRARAVDPRFELDEDNLEEVVELCRRLDGLPLAIELAAARIKLFSPRELLLRLGARLDLLKGGPRDRPARHQTLRGAIDWSYNLLDPNERAVFRTLSVFVGGCTLESAIRVCEVECGADEDVMERIASLVEQNLIRREGGRDGTTRFVMFETIRAYALEALEREGDAEAVRRAHAICYLDLAERAEAELTGPRQANWLDRLETEHDNLRAALSWSVGREESEIALRLSAALWRFWLARGHLQEARERIEAAMSLPARGAGDDIRARALNGLGTIAHNQGENEYARRRLEESLAVWRKAGDEVGIAAVLNNLAWVACELTDLEAARSLSREALELNRKLQETRGVAVALNNLGWVAHYEGDSEAAKRYHSESLALRRRIADQRGIVFALINLAFAEGYGGEHDEALAHLEEALEIVAPLADRLLEGFALLIRVQVFHDRGERLSEMVDLVRTSMAYWRQAGNRSGVAWALTTLGAMLRDLGEHEEARASAREALEMWRSIGGRWGATRALLGLAGVARATERVEKARNGYREALDICLEVGDQLGTAECLEGLASLSAAEGDFALAASMLGKADSLRSRLSAPLPVRLESWREALLSEIRGALGDRFEEAWAAGSSGELEAMYGRS